MPLNDSPNKNVSQTPPLVVGGVPEHFNYPWKMAETMGFFAKKGVNVEFVEQKLGTGAMISGAKSGELDVIIALTEGLVADIASGDSDLQLIGTYVGSPLCWAISTGNTSSISCIEDLRDGRFGVSRMGSGSQLMAYVLAIQRGWDPAKITFEIKGDIHKLCAGVDDNSTDAFLWETFTTKPYHDNGVVRRVGDITTPWPCFMVAARKEVIASRLNEIKACIDAVHEAATLFHQQKDTMPSTIAKEYGLLPEDAQQWYEGVSIVASSAISQTALEKAVDALKVCGKLDRDTTYNVSSFLNNELAHLVADITSMKLYDRSELVVSIHRHLASKGISKGTLQYTDLLPYDQHHYYGTKANDDLIAKASIDGDSRVINIGSGLGGPSRYLAGKSDCSVVACELQDDLSRTAAELTQRCKLDKLIHHMTGDFLRISEHLQPGFYTHIFSYLTVLHFADRADLFRRCFNLLRPDGVFFAADFVQTGALTVEEKSILESDVGCKALAPSIDDYAAELRTAGFDVEILESKTTDWAKYTATRAAEFRKQHDALTPIIGADVHERLARFYDTVAKLFAGGNLGGVEVYARKPQAPLADNDATRL